MAGTLRILMDVNSCFLFGMHCKMRVMEEMQAKQRAKQERLRKLKAKADAKRRERREAGTQA